MQSIFLGIHVGDVFLDAAFVMIDLLMGLACRVTGRGPLIAEDDAHTAVQVGQLTQTGRERVVIELDATAEDLDVRLEAHRGAGAAGISGGGGGERADRGAALKALAVLLPLPMNRDLHPLGEGVHHRHADAVQAARHLVPTGAELAAGVQDGEHGFQSAPAGARVHIGGNAATVIGDGAAAILVEDDEDLVAMASEGLVDRIVDHLVNEVMQTTGPRGADVHARPLTHRLQAFQHLDLLGAVGRLNFRGFAHGFRRGHDLVPSGRAARAWEARRGGALKPNLPPMQ